MANDGAEGWKATRRREPGKPTLGPKAPAGQAKLVRTVGERAVAAIVAAEHGDPFGVLGPHEVAPGVWEVRAMLPEASAAAVTLDAGTTIADGEAARRRLLRRQLRGAVAAELPPVARDRRPDGDARGPLPRSAAVSPTRTSPRCATSAATRCTASSARRPRRSAASAGFNFAVWAPNARRVSVVGDFNDWDGRRHPMRLRHDGGVWELFVPQIAPGHALQVRDQGRRPAACCLRRPTPSPSRPSARRRPPRSCTAHRRFPWRDDEWMTRRAAKDPRHAPISVYECHLGSWARVPEEGNRYLTYRELAEQLIPYVQATWASRISSFCRSPSIPSTAPGATSRCRCSRRRAASARPEEFCSLRRGRARGRHRPHPRLGAGPFPERPARARAFRRHASLRARRPAPGLSPGLGHLHLQLRPPGGRGLPRRQRPLLARALPPRRPARRCRRVDALPRLLAQGRRVGAEPLRRQREPRRHRLPAAHERGRLPRRRRASITDRRGIDRLARRLASDLHRRPRLRLQVEHGLDARHAALHRRRSRCTGATTTTT